MDSFYFYGALYEAAKRFIGEFEMDITMVEIHWYRLEPVLYAIKSVLMWWLNIESDY